ncbi:zinc carboxypeptidase [Longibacter salinarum]|uniref:Zinc carboxypeptidase n=2 Tax=Longibacter salinarum TaxID=1850348 RepID=A0A2A8CXK1_9BACT|nr:zinc carboxypeptidase [Longibacter salinarum]
MGISQPASVAQNAATAPATLQSPKAYLGYDLGQQFTPHHRVVDYVRHVAEASPRVTLQQYGMSVEGRPLLLATLASPENHDQIDAIRKNNLRRAGMADGRVQGPSAAVVWLSYNVHGNESVSTEAAMQTLFEMADPLNDRTGEWLSDTVILLDPCLNPDGRERYVQWYKRTVGRTPSARQIAREHNEPWPNGRSNHYYFDLNRDWAWGVQPETQQRLAVYHEWMPHVHVDFHEQGINDPYYFAPAADPFHEDITDWQRSFQFAIGRNNARYFDQNGWLYFTREVFDLFYPGYGDTWPIFNGAIGMTYEQGGSGRAGLKVITATGDTLTLGDRIAHHHTAGMSTIEVAAENHQTVQEEFSRYYQTAQQNPPGEYSGFVIKSDASGDRLRAVAAHLDRQKIEYGRVAEDGTVSGLRYETGEMDRANVSAGDLLVPAAQPKSRLAKVLLEPRTTIIDSLTYDITSWGLPYAYGLEAVAVTGDLPATSGSIGEASSRQMGEGGESSYAYITRWGSRADARFLGELLHQGFGVRLATQPFEHEGQSYDAGALIIPRADNLEMEDAFDREVRRIASKHNRALHGVASGFVDRGSDLGSSSVRPIKAPHVALLSGSPLSPYRVGEVWYAFDHQFEYPVTLIDTDDADARALEDVDVLVLPNLAGDWDSKEKRSMLAEWVREGGRLVTMGGATKALAGHTPFAIEMASHGADTTAVPRRYADRSRDALTSATPGSIHRASVDTSHPLGFGVGETYYALKRSDDAVSYLKADDGWNVATLADGEPVTGFMGHEAQDRLDETLVFGTQSIGDGTVVYFSGNPLFRGFWYGGFIPFANAVFFVGQ